jgi:AcrR family transcriptional regulator
MARRQAVGFDERRETIVAAAAELIAKNGFHGASTTDISAACNMPQSLLYYYFPAKEDILFAIMWGHVSSLVDLAKSIATRDWLADEALRWFARCLMEAYTCAQARHKILLNEIDHLPPEKRGVIVQAQREVMDVADKYVARLSHSLRDKPKQRVPYVMMFFGMLNSTHAWFDRAGTLTEKKVADIAADMFLKGLPR